MKKKSRRHVNSVSRREFCTFGASAALSAFAGRSTYAQDLGLRPMDVDLIVSNASIYTVDSRVPTAQAFAVKNGRFVAVGGLDDMKGLSGRKTRTYDAKGMIVLPGFIDTHNHGAGKDYFMKFSSAIHMKWSSLPLTALSKSCRRVRERCPRAPGFKVSSMTTQRLKTSDF